MTENTIEMTIDSVDKLNESYLSFLKNGGMIIPIQAELGSMHTVKLNLLAESEPLNFSGKVVWLAPTGAQLPQFNGVGVEFTSANAKTLKSKIESMLA